MKALCRTTDSWWWQLPCAVDQEISCIIHERYLLIHVRHFGSGDVILLLSSALAAFCGLCYGISAHVRSLSLSLHLVPARLDSPPY
jgi:hypothetical protein